ncbi:RelA/SpoT family protein [Microaceticoccus formicicus]|uniref:RelA/SpoT family protein n=1 Tax=Microaceticoccus formicicus TaxID=3118105 RepID=UPI003CD01708|nr:bifunctional (p)ppGpp synthetase/guanosine-3',5'-bis(diphosphate) 3'-pyrophosphohydrolase [Peptoniphilaceae bacterium AMB_02]
MDRLSLESVLMEMDKNKIEYDPKLVKKAYYFTKNAHEGQLRNSGEEYFIHPVNVSLILINLNMDEATIIAAMLHDVLEDTEISFEEIEHEFSNEIAVLVDGVTKLKRLKFKSKQESQAENVRKMVMAMANDIRVIIIKLADRLHNMRTLEYMTKAKQFEKATETLEIYAPLAHRLGINTIKWELEDLSLRYLEPETYYELVEMIDMKRAEREEYISSIMEILRENIAELGFECDITGRPKSIYGIYNKIKKQGKTFDQIFDLTAVRVIVNTVKDCYSVLGVVHSLWKPIQGRFKDYIAMPKANMYQSLHTTVIGPKGEIFEVQIRTWDMHKTAEYGIAAHWKYKEGGRKKDNFDEKLQWLRLLMDWQKDLTDSKEFMETLKGDFFSDEVYVFSPKGDVIGLPAGSTPIDFAYRVHSAVGNHCVGAKIDGRIVPINTKLKNGNIVEILTSPSSSGPSIDWLKIVKSPQARNKIRQWFKKAQKDENIIKGRDALEKEVRRQGFNFNEILKDEWLEGIGKKLSFNNLDDLFASIGYGSTPLTQILPKLKELHKEHYKTDEDIDQISISKSVKPRARSVQGIRFEGIDNLEVKFAKCCNPVPGDEILGYITRGRGVSIHRADCPNMANIDIERVIPVEWDTTKESFFNVHVNILAYDRVGYLANISKIIQDMGLNIANLSARINKDKTFMIDLLIEIKQKEQIDELFKKIMSVEETVKIFRVKAQ